MGPRSTHSRHKDVVLQDARDKRVALLFHPLPPVIGNDRQLHLTAGLRLQCRHPVMIDPALAAEDQDIDVALLIKSDLYVEKR
jgi:hypothetical protein